MRIAGDAGGCFLSQCAKNFAIIQGTNTLEFKLDSTFQFSNKLEPTAWFRFTQTNQPHNSTVAGNR